MFSLFATIGLVFFQWLHAQQVVYFTTHNNPSWPKSWKSMWKQHHEVIQVFLPISHPKDTRWIFSMTKTVPSHSERYTPLSRICHNKTQRKRKRSSRTWAANESRFRCVSRVAFPLVKNDVRLWAPAGLGRPRCSGRRVPDYTPKQSNTIPLSPLVVVDELTCHRIVNEWLSIESFGWSENQSWEFLTLYGHPLFCNTRHAVLNTRATTIASLGVPDRLSSFLF